MRILSEQMDNSQYDSEGTIERIYDQDSLLDILIEFEAVFDSLDLYVFDNWIDGEIVSGPHLERYWIKVILKYPYEKMPDPDGAVRLLKHGAQVGYKKIKEERPVDITKISPNERSKYYVNGKRKKEIKEAWLIYVKMPRRFIEDMDIGIVDMDDEEDVTADLSVAQDAEDEGLEDETMEQEELGREPEA